MLPIGFTVPSSTCLWVSVPEGRHLGQSVLLSLCFCAHICGSLPFGLCVSFSLCVSPSVSSTLFLGLSKLLSVYLFLCLSVFLSIYLFPSVSLGLSVLFCFVSTLFYLFISPSLYLCGYFSSLSSLPHHFMLLSFSLSVSESLCMCL